MEISSKLLGYAADQDGLVTRRQCRAEGLTEPAIRHALGADGPWQKVVPGVYATFTGPLQERHNVRAAILHAGPEGVVTGAYACRAYGMKYAPAAPTIEILLPQHVRRAPIKIATIRRVRSMPVGRTLQGIRTAAPERAVLDAARGGKSLRNVRAVVCEVVQLGLSTPDRVAGEFSRVDQRAMGFVRQALEDIRAGCRSAPECELRDLVLMSATLPEPVWNQPLPGGDGVIPDGYLEEVRLVLEVESMEHHQFGAAPELTERRRALYASLGWRVYPVSPRRIREEPAVVLAEIEAAAMSDMLVVSAGSHTGSRSVGAGVRLQ